MYSSVLPCPGPISSTMPAPHPNPYPQTLGPCMHVWQHAPVANLEHRACALHALRMSSPIERFVQGDACNLVQSEHAGAQA